MKWLQIKSGLKKVWLWSKKFWWVIIIALLFICAALIGAITRNGVLLASVIDLLESKRDSHDKEMETLNKIHQEEISKRKKILEEYHKNIDALEEEYAKKDEELSLAKKNEVKRLVEDSYNDPERLAREIAAAFGITNG